MHGADILHHLGSLFQFGHRHTSLTVSGRYGLYGIVQHHSKGAMVEKFEKHKLGHGKNKRGVKEGVNAIQISATERDDAINAPSWRAKALSCTTSSIRIINKNMCIIKRMQSYSKGMVKQNKMKHIFGWQRVKDV